MITCVKGGPRWRDVVKVYGAGEFKGCYNRLKCYLARSHVQKHVWNWAYPPSYRYPRYTMKFWVRLKQPVSWFQSEVAFTILKRDKYIF